jgi:hypothetical protein
LKEATLARTRVIRSAIAVISATLAFGILVGCGGGGSTCAETTVYDSYGYSPRRVQGEIDEPVSVELLAHVTSGCTLSHKLEGNLPPGVHFDSRTGDISGTPTAGGIYDVDVHPDASGTVSTHLTLEIQPLGRQADTVNLVHLNPPTDIGFREFSRIAATQVDGHSRLWIGGFQMRDETGATVERFRFFRSDDEGASWVGDNAGDLLKVRGNTIYEDQFLFGGNGRELFVLDTGGYLDSTPIPSALYRFDGTNWSVRNTHLPFRAPSGASSGFYVAPTGQLAVVFATETGNALWTSNDGGLNWIRQTQGDGEPLEVGPWCLGKTGEQWRVGTDTFLVDSVGSGTDGWPWEHYAKIDNAVCASDGTRMWVVGQRDGGTGDMVITDLVEGEALASFPRRVPDMPSSGLTGKGNAFFTSLAATNGHLFGLVADPYGHASYDLWKLH